MRASARIAARPEERSWRTDRMAASIGVRRRECWHERSPIRPPCLRRPRPRSPAPPSRLPATLTSAEYALPDQRPPVRTGGVPIEKGVLGGAGRVRWPRVRSAGGGARRPAGGDRGHVPGGAHPEDRKSVVEG